MSKLNFKKMEKQILEVQKYFEDKILNLDFEVKDKKQSKSDSLASVVNWIELDILIDGKFEFKIHVGKGVEGLNKGTVFFNQGIEDFIKLSFDQIDDSRVQSLYEKVSKHLF